MAPMALSPKIKLSDGNEIPLVGLGTYKAQPGEVYEAVCHAIDVGYRHLDCALVYENEAEIGRAIRDKINSGAVKRDDLFITSKCWNTFRSPALIDKGLEQTLKDLGVDYVDLYLIHWPFSWVEGGSLFPADENGKFPENDIDFMDVWRTMERFQKEGKAKSIGISNFNSKQIERVLKEGTVRPVVNQVEAHPYLTQERLQEFCEERGIKLVAYCPLGSPYRHNTGEFPVLLEHPDVLAIAKVHNVTPAQVLVRYMVERGIIVIPKSSNKGRIASNFDVFGFQLSKDEVKALSALNKNFRLCPFVGAADCKEYPFTLDF